MRIPSMWQVESALKRYALRALAVLLISALASSGIFFRDRLVSLLVQAPSDDLAATVIWLAFAVVVVIFVGAFYFLKSWKLEKAVLKFDSNFYAHQEFDNAWDETSKNL